MMRIVVVMVAILAGGGAGWLALQATWREPTEPVTVVLEEQKVDVLTPNVDLMRGAKVSTEHLVWTPWPATQVKSGMILKDEEPDARADLSGRILRSNLYTGEPVRMQHLAKGEGSFLSMALQPGSRAIGVQISEDKTAGGFILPNDRVDVLHTVVRDIDGDGTATGATRTILTNVRVLAIGQTTFEGKVLVADDAVPTAQSDGGDGSTLTGETATLEVSGEQAEVLLAAAASGQLALALRAADDFGLSGIGDLAMIEGVAPPTETVVPISESAPELEVPDAAPRQREVMIVSAGVSQIVLTAAKNVQ